MQTVFFVANRTFAISNSRATLIKSLVASRYKVLVIASLDEHKEKISSLGAQTIHIPFFRGGASLISDLYALCVLAFFIVRHRPVLIHAFNAKPVIFTGLLLRFLPVRSRSVSVITGLGHAFIHGNFIKRLAGKGYGLSLNRASNHTVFQNQDDMDLFLSEGWADEQRSSLILGSGVDVNRFCPVREPQNENAGVEPKIVLMIGRLLNQKGVGEYIAAARMVKEQDPSISFKLIGERDEVHPDAIDFNTLQTAVADGAVEYLGFQADILPFLRATSVFVLPSYREGVPRTVLEAAACGIPVIGADVPGTKECIIGGKTGFLVEVRSAEAIAEKVDLLFKDESLRRTMSENARTFMLETFDILDVSKKYIDIYRSFGGLNVSE